jgi:hypothetical protein
MKRRRARGGISPKIIIALTLFISCLCATQATAGDTREIQIGNLDYVISIPAEWEKSYLEGTMKLHLKVLPKMEVQGRFTVYAQDRGAVGFEDWVQYHKEKNLPLMYGNFLIGSEREAKAGACRAWIIQMLDLEGRAGYGSYDTLIVTEHHVIMINVLYDLYQAGRAWQDLENILASFSSDPEVVKRARLSYEEGRTLGLDSFGLFLRLPEGWFPEKFSNSCDYGRIRLPSGGFMEVAAAKRVPKGIDGLKNVLERKITGLELIDGESPCALGPDEAEAFSLEFPATDDALPMVLIYGLHGKGGYGIALHSKAKDEKKLFHKIAARALLMDPSEAKEMKTSALARFPAHPGAFLRLRKDRQGAGGGIQVRGRDPGRLCDIPGPDGFEDREPGPAKIPGKRPGERTGQESVHQGHGHDRHDTGAAKTGKTAEEDTEKLFHRAQKNTGSIAGEIPSLSVVSRGQSLHINLGSRE